MPDFMVERSASMALGNTCATCSTHAHERGFVNLGIDVLAVGRLYVCAGCADAIGRAVGGLDPRQAQILRDAADELAEVAEKAGRELEVVKENMVVPLADVIDLVRERERRRPTASVPAVSTWDDVA